MEESETQYHRSVPEPHGIVLRPVGIIESKIKEPVLAAVEDGIQLQGELKETRAAIREMDREISRIVINEELKSVLDGIEGYSHLIILYWAHKVPEKSRCLTKVHPMGRRELPLVGIFGTCSPVRPNPVLMTVVRLCGQKQNVLEVTGLDAVDGAPVVDIKPYVKSLYPQEGVVIPEWMRQIVSEMEESKL